MELVSSSPILLKLVMISLLYKRLLILHYLTNVYIYFYVYQSKKKCSFFTQLEVPVISIKHIVKVAVESLVLW